MLGFIFLESNLTCLASDSKDKKNTKISNETNKRICIGLRTATHNKSLKK